MGDAILVQQIADDASNPSFAVTWYNDGPTYYYSSSITGRCADCIMVVATGAMVSGFDVHVSSIFVDRQTYSKSSYYIDTTSTSGSTSVSINRVISGNTIFSSGTLDSNGNWSLQIKTTRTQMALLVAQVTLNG